MLEGFLVRAYTGNLGEQVDHAKSVTRVKTVPLLTKATPASDST